MVCPPRSSQERAPASPRARPALPLLSPAGLPGLAGKNPGPPRRRSPQDSGRPAPPRPALPARLSSSLSSSLPQARHRPASGHWHGLLPPLGTPRSRCPHGRGLLVSHVSARRHCLRDALLTVPAGAAPSQPRSCPHRAQLCPSGGSVLETILLFTRLFSVSLQLPAAPGRWGMASLLSSAGSPVPRTGPGTQ